MSDDNTQENQIILNVQDIAVAANIIDLATQRGAFKAAEAGTVGAVFSKFAAFVKANAPETEEPAEAEQE